MRDLNDGITIINRADVIDTVDVKKADRIKDLDTGKVNIDGAADPNTNIVGTNQAKNLDIGIVDIERTNGVKDSNTSIVDTEEAERAEHLDIGTARINGVKNLDLDITDIKKGNKVENPDIGIKSVKENLQRLLADGQTIVEQLAT